MVSLFEISALETSEDPLVSGTLDVWVVRPLIRRIGSLGLHQVLRVLTPLVIVLPFALDRLNAIRHDFVLGVSQSFPSKRVVGQYHLVHGLLVRQVP